MARPPRLADFLLRASMERRYAEVILGDLREEFLLRVQKEGARSARRWYWRQVRRSLWPNLQRRVAGATPGRLQGQGGPKRSIGMGGLGLDLRYALRSLRANPGMTAVVLIVVALGIGAMSAVFSVVDAVVLHPLPYADPDSLVAVRETQKVSPLNLSSVYPQDFVDWSSRQTVFQGLTAVAPPLTGSFTDLSAPEPALVHAERVSPNLFGLLGITPERGRAFADDREVVADPMVAVISDGYWHTRFGADPTVIGRTLVLDSGDWRIVGVMPPSFVTPVGGTMHEVLGAPTDIWIPLVIPESDYMRGNDHNSYLDVIGRLKPGVTLAQAQAQMSQISNAIITAYPSWYRYGGRAEVHRLADWVIGSPVRSWMLMLFGAVTCVLLIACVNVANLLLARATARIREAGVRIALGASRWRVVRGLLVEGLLLSATGTLLALMFAYWLVPLLRGWLPPGLPREDLIAVNGRVLWAALLAAIGTGITFGLVPALSFSDVSVGTILREGARSGMASVSRQRLRSALVIGEMALAVALVVGASLFLASFAKLLSVNVGVSYEGVLTASISPVVSGATSDARTAAGVNAMRGVLARAQVLPGVSSVAVLAGALPFSGGFSRVSMTRPGQEAAFLGDDAADLYAVTPDYFKVVRLPVIKGRGLTDADDRSDAAPVVLLNETAVRRYFDRANPIGQLIGWPDPRTVVGIVADTRPLGPDQPVRPAAYTALGQGGRGSGYILLRADRDVKPLIQPLHMLVAATMTHHVAPEPVPLSQLFDRLIAQRRFSLFLIGLFGALGLAIAVAGVYGVMAYLVEQRAQEIGVRIALGAPTTRVVGMVLARASIMLSAGVGLGLGLAWIGADSLRTFLFGVAAHDWEVFVIVSVVLFLTGLGAAYLPARRAARVDPVIALRAE